MTDWGTLVVLVILLAGVVSCAHTEARPPTRNDLIAAFWSHPKEMHWCFDNNHDESGNLLIKLRVKPNGKVDRVDAEGWAAHSGESDCLLAIASRLRFPAFVGGPVEISFQMSLPGPFARFRMPEPTPSPAPLSREQILGVILPHAAAVEFCFDKYFQPGTLLARFIIHPDGQVEIAEPSGGELAGSAEGECILRQLSHWRFPAFEGQPYKVQFPFRFRGSPRAIVPRQ